MFRLWLQRLDEIDKEIAEEEKDSDGKAKGGFVLFVLRNFANTDRGLKKQQQQLEVTASGSGDGEEKTRARSTKGGARRDA